MQVSVIIPTMKGREAMLEKLLSTIPNKYEKIVVGDEDLLLAAKRNKGAKKAKGEYLFFVDDDNYLEPGAIEAAVSLCEHAEVGIVGFTACYDDKKGIVADGGSLRNMLTGFTTGIRTNERICDEHWLPTHRGRWGVERCSADEPYEVDEVANAFMIHAEDFFMLYGFDEKNFPIDLDEADLCKRIKDLGMKVMMCPKARCYHKSQTYSHIPDFRRPMNAYFMGRNRTIYQRKFNNPLRYGVYLVFFMPVFIGFYTLSLIGRKKPLMVLPFLKGVFDGLLGRRKNRYQ